MKWSQTGAVTELRHSRNHQCKFVHLRGPRSAPMDAEVGMSPKFQNDDPMSCSGKVFNKKNKKEREKSNFPVRGQPGWPWRSV